MPTSWPEARDEVPTSWPEAGSPPQPGWPDAGAPPQPGWPEPPGPEQRGGRPQEPLDARAAHGADPLDTRGAQAPGPLDTPGIHAPGQHGSHAPDPRSSPSPDPRSSRAPDPRGSRAADPLDTRRPLGGEQPRDPLPAWSDASATQNAWPETPKPAKESPGQQVWPETPPPAETGWANLSSPAPWPPAGPPQQDPWPPAPPQAHDNRPAGDPTDHTITYNEAQPTPAAPPQQQPPQQAPQQERPGANLSRDPSDPDRPFVTAGQISGSRTPPPERQQELWNTVFGDDYQEMGELDEKRPRSERGKPVWLFALAGSVAVALVIALVWAFVAGPLASQPPQADPPPATKPAGSAKPPTGKPSNSIGPLKRYPGRAAPVLGVLPDPGAGISVPRLGGTWLLDQRPVVKTTYGYDTRQYVKVGVNTYANLLTGPLPQNLASSFTAEDDLEPVIKQVVLNARKRFFPAGNKVRKIAQQQLKIGGSTAGRVIAYELTSPAGKATIVAAAVNTANELPSIVYMSVPDEAKQLLPDINTVIKQLKITNPG
ncbi:hypothetical protein [Nonomuraea typhae]|uniref:Uncharacterized protein n=1 Tax=Nonomuraea typhae TaxID=2603600 RepID=A0ABW7ZA11_9ACTN